MLRELKSFESLGTPRYFYELLDTLKKSNLVWHESDVKSLFHNRAIDGRRVFDGCVHIALAIGLLCKNASNEILVSPQLFNFLNSEKQLSDKFVELLLISLNKDDEFHEIFSSKHISYDVIYHTIQISNTAFAFRYASFKQLLLDFEIIKVHPTKEFRKYIFNSRYKKLFDKSILPEIRKRKIGIEELIKELEQKQIYGEEAELFVLNFEKKRLNNKGGIEWIAEYSSSEGYDILSFNSQDSTRNDRCIEAKSYSGHPYFFWTRNEINIARIKADEYYLYLVNRDKISLPGYEPMIIQNPYKVILGQNVWIKEIERYRIELDVDDSSSY